MARKPFEFDRGVFEALSLGVESCRDATPTEECRVLLGQFPQQRVDPAYPVDREQDGPGSLSAILIRRHAPLVARTGDAANARQRLFSSR